MLDELELGGVLVGLAEEAGAGAEEQREDEQVVAVDQAGVGEAGAQGGAAVDGDRAALGLLEGSDVVDRAQDRGRPPGIGVLQGGGYDVLQGADLYSRAPRPGGDVLARADGAGIASQ